MAREVGATSTGWTIVAIAIAAISGGTLLARQFGSSRCSVTLVDVSMAQVEARIQQYRDDHGRLPATLDELATDAAGSTTAPALRDPWGREYFYRPMASSFLLFTLGADGRLGGSDHSADLQIESGSTDAG